MKLSTIVGLVVGACVAASLLDSATTRPSTGPQISTAPSSLRLLDSRCFTEHGFRQIVGQVKNMTDRPIATVLAVGTFTTAAGDLVKVENALLEYDPIMPGQTSPFRVMGTDNPMISNCEIRFRRMFGGEISFSR